MRAGTAFEDLCRQVLELPQSGARHLIAVAGPPGSGKSTVAKQLVDALAGKGRDAKLVPMDGFHLDNALLEQDGTLARKGAPETFDLAGFAALVARIAQGDDVCFPLFDRTRDIAIAQADRISETVDVAVIEGNYLLLDRPLWRDLSAFWRLSVWLDVPTATLRERLLSRWLDHGLEPSAAAERCDGNDMCNVRLVTDARLASSVTLTSP